MTTTLISDGGDGREPDPIVGMFRAARSERDKSFHGMSGTGPVAEFHGPRPPIRHYSLIVPTPVSDEVTVELSRDQIMDGRK